MNKYLVTGFRIFKRHRGYSFINITGLAIGLTCFIVIALVIKGELEVDGYHERGDRIYRVIRVDSRPGMPEHVAVTPAPLAAALKRTFPDVEKASAFNFSGGATIRFGNATFKQERLTYAEPDFFEMFSFAFLEGNPGTALIDPHSAVLTEDTARKIFGETDPLGQILRVRGMSDLKVTAVIKNHKDSHLHLAMIVPFALHRERGVNIDSWNQYNYTTYVQLRENSDADAFASKVRSVMPDLTHPANPFKLEIQPLRRIYLHSQFEYDYHAVTIDIKILYILGSLALLILFIACVNFTNLTTALSARRAREVGLRKMLGANRRQLITQFLGETLLTTIFSMICAILIVEIVLPLINNSQPFKEYSLIRDAGPLLIPVLILVTIITAVIAGGHPAFVLSRFRSVRILSGHLDPFSQRGRFRKVLVTVQFTLSIILIFTTLVIFRQASFLHHQDLGFEREGLMVLRLPAAMKQDYRALKADLLRQPAVLGVTACMNLPNWQGPSFVLDDWDGRSDDLSFSMYHGSVDPDYFDILGLTILEGRAFAGGSAADETNAIIINEEAARIMGMDDPVGKRMSYFGGPRTIIGIVKNFHFATLRRPIEPLALDPSPDVINYVLVKINPASPAEVESRIRTVWNHYDPDDMFEMTSLDSVVKDVYRDERTVATLFNAAAILSLVISCLGLFSLAVYAVEQRFKEVGIRKVLGASHWTIFRLFSGEYLKLIAVSLFIALPLGFIAMQLFLRKYPYRTAIGPDIFFLVVLAAFLIAFLTVFSQSLKAARLDPVKIINYE